jgi:glutathione synthase/RimK-type ligase-like ATP-grasp enzyme
MRALLFKSEERFEAFKKRLEELDVEVIVEDFEGQSWLNIDFSKIDIVIYFSSFKYSSNHPLSLQAVYDNLAFIYRQNPKIAMFPDPKGIHYYNDKYRQFLFLSTHGYPIPDTMPLQNRKDLDIVEKTFGYPVVIKNRYGAGGGSVFRAFDRKQLETFYNISTLNLYNYGALKYFIRLVCKRSFFYHLIKAKKCVYPLLSSPLIAQRFIKIDRDLKTVVGDGKVVEAHWRHQAHEQQWKVNIDDGGIGVWGHVPDEPIEISIRLAEELKTRWLNLDMLVSKGKFLITEFSPVWHHYAYKEKDSFVYKEDYNIEMPLKMALDLELIVVQSLVKAAKEILHDRV